MASARPPFIPDFERIPDFPENGTSGEGWLDWVDELLDNIFGGIPTFDDIRDFLTDTSWEDFVPDTIPSTDDISDLISAIYDKIEDEIDPAQYIPDAVIDELNDMDIAKGVAELASFGYDMIVDGEYIDPWSGKVLDYSDFNLVLPKTNKTKVKGTKKNDLMSGHWESHNYDGKGGNDYLFTWYGNDTLKGGSGNDRLYVDGGNCTMTGGKGKDHFYLDRDGYALIKDYEKKDKIYVGDYSKGEIKVKTKKGDSIIKAGKNELAKVKDTKLSKSDLKFGDYYDPKTMSVIEDDHDHSHDGHDHDHDHAHERAINLSDILIDTI